MSAPIKYTCPSIDAEIRKARAADEVLASCIDDLDSLIMQGDFDSATEKILKKITERLEGMDLPSESSLEELRSSNSSLRAWGEAGEDEANELEKLIEYLKRDHAGEVENLEDSLNTLQSSFDALEDQLYESKTDIEDLQKQLEGVKSELKAANKLIEFYES